MPDAARPLEPADFHRLYTEFAPALQVWATLRIQPQLRAFCEPTDLLQEIWCRAYAIRDRFDRDEASFRPWLFRVAKNVLLEVVQEARLSGRVRHGDGRTSRMFRLAAVADDVTTITQKVARDETLASVRDRIDSLAREERQLVIQLGLEGKKYAEVATQMGLSHDAVKKRWHRLRARLEAEGLADTLLE